jgi:hypothetical protein
MRLARFLWIALWGTLGLATRAEAQPKTPTPPDRYEPGLLPAFGGDTDVGFKFGAFAQLARFRDDIKPYAWRAQLLGEASVDDGPTGTEFPYREGYLKVDIPRAWGDSLRLLTELSYLRTTNRGYYGLGNSSHAEKLWAGIPEGTDDFVRARRRYQYDGTMRQARAVALMNITSEWRWFGDVALRWAQVDTYEGSLLERDIGQGAGSGQSLWGTGQYVQPQFAAGIVYDTRDHETVTTTGQYHDVSIRCAPRGSGAEPYCGVNLTARGYVPIAAENLSIGARVLGDVLTDRVALMELSRYGGIAAGPSVGGTRGIRGIPQGRYHGRTKLIGNIELRSFLLSFALGDQKLALGLAAFADAGRVWTDALSSVESLDGSGWGMHWGAGAGPRLRWGDSLVIRADIAYSPEGAAIGASPAVYIDVEPVM